MKKYLSILLFTAAVTSLTSCLKDDRPNLTPTNSPAVVEFSSSTLELPSSSVGTKYALYERAYELDPNIEMPYVINYTGGSAAPKDIKIKLGIKPEAIDEYVAEQAEDGIDLHYTLLPSAFYSIPAEVTIPKGQRMVKINVKLNTTLITDFDAQYVLPISITDADGTTISGNYGTILTKVSVKNKYDGNFTVTATAPMVDVTNATLTGYYPLDSDLVTTSPNSVVMFCNTYLGGLQGHPIKSGTANSYYGNFAPIFTMDDNGNVTSVTNFYGQGGNSSNRSARLDPSGVNKFTVSADGTSKTLEVSYIMVQNGSDRTFFHEKWTFEGSR